jgi:predicted RNase H-like nuclease
VRLRTTEAPTYDDANERCRAITGKGLSKQAFAIFPTILEVGALVGGKTCIVEVHPEVCFATLAGAPLSKKKSWGGMKRRIELLDRAGLVLPHDLSGASDAPPDDVLDASVAAWSGARFLRGEAVRVGSDDGQRRGDGEPIAIWA